MADGSKRKFILSISLQVAKHTVNIEKKEWRNSTPTALNFLVQIQDIFCTLSTLILKVATDYKIPLSTWMCCDFKCWNIVLYFLDRLAQGWILLLYFSKIVFHSLFAASH